MELPEQPASNSRPKTAASTALMVILICSPVAVLRAAAFRGRAQQSIDA
jgi:hypothetical protein